MELEYDVSASHSLQFVLQARGVVVTKYCEDSQQASTGSAVSLQKNGHSSVHNLKAWMVKIEIGGAVERLGFAWCWGCAVLDQDQTLRE